MKNYCLPTLLFFLSVLALSVKANTLDTLQAFQQLEVAKQQIDSLNYESAINICREVAQALEAVDQRHPKIGETYNIAGDAYWEQGQYDKALAFYLNAEDILQKGANKQNSELAQSYNNIGLVYWKKGQIQQAVDYFQRSLEMRVNIFGQAHSKVADSFNNLGNCFLNINNIKQAKEYYNRALQIRLQLEEPDPLDIASSYNNLGLCERYDNNYKAALSYYEQSLDLRKTAFGIKHPKVGQSFLNLGDCYAQMNELERAQAYYKEALAIMKSAYGEEHPEIANIYNNLGNVYSQWGDYRQALPYLEKARDVQLAFHESNSPQLISIYNNLANIYTGNGDYANALLYYENNLTILEQHFGRMHPYAAVTYDNIASVKAKMQSYEEALFNHQQALFVYTHHKDAASAAATYNNIGNRWWEVKNYPLALENYENALEGFEKVAETNILAKANCMNNIGNCYSELKEYEKAESYYNQAIQITIEQYGEDYIPLTEYYLSLGVLNQLKNEIPKSIELFGKGLDIQQKKIKGAIEFINPMEAIRLLSARGNAYEDLFKNNKSINYLKLAFFDYGMALKQVEDLRQNYEEEDSGRNLSETTYQIFEGLIRVAYQLYEQSDDESYIEKAFKYSEKSRSSAILQAQNKTDAAFFAGIPDSLLQKEKSIQFNINYLEKNRRDEILKGTMASPDIISELNKRIFTAKRKRTVLIEQFEKDYPDYYELKHNTRTVTFKTIQKDLLQKDQCLLEYFIADDNLYSFILTKEKVHFQKTEADSLLQLVSDFRTGIYRYYADATLQTEKYYQSFLSQYIQSAHQLYEVLIQPHEAILKEKVIIIQGDILTYLPFDALLSSMPTENASIRSMDFLLKEYQISYAGSATLLEKIKSKERESAPKELLAYAPTFAQPNKENFLPLQYNANEAEQVATLMNGEALVGNQATLASFLTQAKNYKNIHLATHAQADQNKGDFSFLAFTNKSEEDYLLYAKDIYNMELNADMVVLSACQTGEGQLVKGEGVVSLARSFFYAGAKSIITTLWSINDASTNEIMSLFYQYLQTGISKDEALRMAKLHYLQESGQTHPFFWAAFIPVGDMSAPNGSGNKTWLAGLGALFAALGLRRFIKR